MNMEYNTGYSKLVLTFSNGYNSGTKNCTMWNNTPKKSKKYAILRDMNFI